jgi:hypothetical protein
MLTGQKISDTTFGLRAMRAEVTGAVRLEQPQYQASELLIGVITHGYKVAEVPATIHRRRVGESKKGQNPLYGLHLPGVNNLFYGVRFARVVYGTWWRERQRAGQTEASARAEAAELTEVPERIDPAGQSGVPERIDPAGQSGVPERIDPAGQSGVPERIDPAGQSGVPERLDQAGESGSAGSSSGRARSGPVDSAARANGSGPGSVEASASSAAAGLAAPVDPAKRT